MHECVLATSFLVGRMAAAYPDLARRELAEGHTVAYHSFGHRLLDRMKPEGAEAEIDRGFAAADKAVYCSPAAERPSSAFRASPRRSIRWTALAARNIAVFDADLWASDWNAMTPDQELKLVLAGSMRPAAAHAIP